jgi:two-component system sensor histidine kinase QseC
MIRPWAPAVTLESNGEPAFTFSPAVSMSAHCDTQEEVDRLWTALAEGGGHGQCGRLTDRFGVSWQVVPRQRLSHWKRPSRDADGKLW